MTVIVTVLLNWSGAAGLKLQEIPTGKVPPQNKLNGPSPLLESSVKARVADPGRLTTSDVLLNDIWIGGPIWVGSVAVLLF